MSSIGIWPAFLDDADPEQIACRGADTRLFFPELGETGEKAKKICRTCPLKDTCRDWALNQPYNQVWGIWGGLSDMDRKRWRAARRPKPAVPASRCEACRPYSAAMRNIHHAQHHTSVGVAA